MNDEVVKLVQNAAVKELLQEATKTNRIIDQHITLNIVRKMSTRNKFNARSGSHFLAFFNNISWLWIGFSIS